MFMFAGIFVILVSFMDLAEQATLQLILTAYRFLAFTIMLITCIVAMMHPNVFDAHASQSAPYVSEMTRVDICSMT